jgi:hypothetical protein
MNTHRTLQQTLAHTYIHTYAQAAVPRNSVEEVSATSFWFLVLMVVGAIAFINRRDLSDKLNKGSAGAGGPSDKAADLASAKNDRKKTK